MRLLTMRVVGPLGARTPIGHIAAIRRNGLAANGGDDKDAIAGI
jgi:hypothetical protein